MPLINFEKLQGCPRLPIKRTTQPYHYNNVHLQKTGKYKSTVRILNFFQRPLGDTVNFFKRLSGNIVNFLKRLFKTNINFFQLTTVPHLYPCFADTTLFGQSSHYLLYTLLILLCASNTPSKGLPEFLPCFIPSCTMIYWRVLPNRI